MNGSTLTLGLVGALAVGAVLRRRGSRSIDPLDLLERCGEENGGDDGLYHVTRTALLPAIRAHGLVPNPKAIQPTFDETPSKHLKGRVFFAVSVPVAAEWWNQISVFLNEERRSEPLSLLRIRPGQMGDYVKQLQHDEVGAEDVHPCSFFVSGRVAPEDIEIAKPKRAFGNTLSKVFQKVMENPEKEHWDEAFVWVPLGRRGSCTTTPAPVVLYHGAQRWEGAPEIVAHRKGHAEHGPGIYLTTSYETAARYAKGGGSVYRIELDPRVGWVQDVRLPYAETAAWVKGLPRLRGKTELLAGLAYVAARVGDLLPGEILVNQFVNADAASGQHGPALAAFLVAHGADASHVLQSGEDWVVVFNPKVIRSVTKVPAKQVGAGFAFDLPKVRA